MIELGVSEFIGYKQDLILKLVRKHRWVKNFKNFTMLEKEVIEKKE